MRSLCAPALLLLAASNCDARHLHAAGPLLHLRGGSANNDAPHLTRPLLQLRGGSSEPATAAELTRAKLLLLVSNAGFGSYSVTLRLATSLTGAEPLGTVFITFVRYSFLFLFASITRCLRSIQARREAQKAGDAYEASSAGDKGASAAAFELALYSVACALLSVWGTCRVTSAMSEIFASTDHVFVPLLSLVLDGGADFGPRTWAACILAFGAAIMNVVIDNMRGGGGGGGGGGSMSQRSLQGAAALVASALAYATMRVRTTVRLRSFSAESLNLLRMCWMGGLSALMLAVDVALGGPSALTLRRLSHIRPGQWALLAGGVFITGFLSASLQFEAMRYVSAAKAQPFAALQPVFAGLFGWMVLREEVSRGTAVGGVLMIIAALLGCAEEEAEAEAEAAVQDLGAIEEATPDVAETTFPLESRLELVEGAILDEVVHPLPPTRRRPNVAIIMLALSTLGGTGKQKRMAP